MSTEKPIRVQFEISPTLAKEMEKFEHEAEISSHREFYANLISLWRWAAKRSKEGKIIAAIHPEKLTYNEITLPALDTLKMKARAERELALAGLTQPKDEATVVGHAGITVQPAPGFSVG